MLIAEYGVLKTLIYGRPTNERMADTFKAIMSTTTDATLGGCRLLLSVQAVLPYATPEAERGFSVMKEAKGERQANMETVVLSARININLNGPVRPGTIC